MLEKKGIVRAGCGKSARPVRGGRTERQSGRSVLYSTGESCLTGKKQASRIWQSWGADLEGDVMAKMRVVQVPRAKGDFEIVQRDIPEPGAGFVRIKGLACGVCH